MSDEPFTIRPTPLMTPEKARDIARDFKAWSVHLAEQGLAAESAVAARDSQWWLTYSITLAQLPKREG